MRKQTNQEHRQVVLFGLATLQNSILAGHIQQQLQTACTFQPKLEWPATLGKLSRIKRQLVLIDAEVTQRDAFYALLEQIHEQEANIAIAFYGAKKFDFIEHLINWPLVNGIFYHDTEQQQFCRGIEAIFRGECWLPRHLLATYLQDTRKLPQGITAWRAGLTPREKEILLLVATGARNYEIANKLDLSRHTIKTHLYNAFKKIGVENRVQAINWCKDHLKEAAQLS